MYKTHVVFLNFPTNQISFIQYFIKIFLQIFYNLFSYMCIKMSKNSSAKFYQKTKEKKFTKDIKVYLKKKKKKSKNLVVNNTKVYQKMKNKSWLSIKKYITKWEETYDNHKKLFWFRKLFFLPYDYVRCSGKNEKLFLLLQNHFLGNQSHFISHFCLKSLLGRVNQ